MTHFGYGTFLSSKFFQCKEITRYLFSMKDESPLSVRIWCLLIKDVEETAFEEISIFIVKIWCVPGFLDAIIQSTQKEPIYPWILYDVFVVYIEEKVSSYTKIKPIKVETGSSVIVILIICVRKPYKSIFYSHNHDRHHFFTP